MDEQIVAGIGAIIVVLLMVGLFVMGWEKYNHIEFKRGCVEYFTHRPYQWKDSMHKLIFTIRENSTVSHGFDLSNVSDEMIIDSANVSIIRGEG